MPRLDLYGPAYAGQPAPPLFVLPSSTDEREAWSGRIAALPRLADDRRAAFLADYRGTLVCDKLNNLCVTGTSWM